MAVSETIVREYFELHDFFVRQNRKHIAPKREDDEVDFYVHNPNGPTEGGEVPFVVCIGDRNHSRRVSGSVARRGARRSWSVRAEHESTQQRPKNR